MIGVALEPARAEFKPAALKTLMRSLALIMGPEATIVVFQDVAKEDWAQAGKLASEE